MTYDDWKTTEPPDDGPPPDDLLCEECGAWPHATHKPGCWYRRDELRPMVVAGDFEPDDDIGF